MGLCTNHVDESGYGVAEISTTGKVTTNLRRRDWKSKLLTWTYKGLGGGLSKRPHYLITPV